MAREILLSKKTEQGLRLDPRTKTVAHLHHKHFLSWVEQAEKLWG